MKRGKWYAIGLLFLAAQPAIAQKVRNVSIQVLNQEGEPVSNAKVTTGKTNVTYDKAGKIFKLDNYKGDTLKLSFSAKGYLPGEKTVNLSSYQYATAHEPVTLMLSRKGDLWYYNGKEKVPYKPTPELIGIIPTTKAYTNLDDHEGLLKLIQAQNMEIVAYDKAHKANLLPPIGTKDVKEQVIILRKKDKTPFDRNNCKELEALRRSGFVTCAGPLLNSRTILSNRITTQFSDYFELKKDSVFSSKSMRIVQNYGDNYDQVQAPEGIGEELLNTMDMFMKKGIVKAVFPDICVPSEE